MNPFIIALIPSTLFGTLNWVYWRTKGYKSFETVFFSYIAFYGISVMIIKTFQ